MNLCMCINIYIPKYGLFSLCNATCVCMFSYLQQIACGWDEDTSVKPDLYTVCSAAVDLKQPVCDIVMDTVCGGKDTDLLA